MKRQIITAILYTCISALVLGVIYPLAMTAVAQVLFRAKANGGLITRDGSVIGSRLIGQGFSSPGYFHSRPSSAGTGYDAAASSGSNLGPTSSALRDSLSQRAAAEHVDHSQAEIPVDLITGSGSGLDPDISPAAALYQIPRIAQERKLSEDRVRSLVVAHMTARQFGLLGEPRVNVLELNLALDADAAHSP